jgi:hypothetical protein
MRDERLHGSERWALWALAAILATSVAWWAAALWPLPPATPEWVIRARAACFGTARSGLPNAGGWILLIGTPISLTLALLVIAGREVRGGLASLRASRGGRAAVLAVAVLLVVLAGAASARVATASGFRGFVPADPPVAALAPDRLVRLDREAPRLDLVDQHGERVRL